MPFWIWAAMAVGVAGNLDNLSVGIAYGMRRTGIPPRTNLFIALVAAIGTLALGYTSSDLARVLPPVAANFIGGTSIVAVGVWVLWPRRDEPQPERIPPEESLALAVGLGVNAWVGGFGGGLVGIPPWALALAGGGGSFLALWFGGHVGRSLPEHWPEGWMNAAAGILLIFVGLRSFI